MVLFGSCWGVFLSVFAVMFSGELASHPQSLLPLGCRASPALARDRGSMFSGTPGELTEQQWLSQGSVILGKKNHLLFKCLSKLLK